MDAVNNFAKGTIDGTLEQTVTTFSLLAGQGARFPAPPFNVVIWNATDYSDPADDPAVEILRVTAIATDDFTVTRGQEGTADEEHATAGKTYQIILAFTKQSIISLLGNVFDPDGTGSVLLVDASAGEVKLRQLGTTRYIQLTSAGIEVQGTKVTLGDLNGEQNSTNLFIDDDNTLFRFFGGQLASDQIQSASVAPGTLAGKLAFHDGAGDLVGYVPIYTTIT